MSNAYYGIEQIQVKDGAYKPNIKPLNNLDKMKVMMLS